MKTKILALKADVSADLQAIEQVYLKLAGQSETAKDDEQAIVTGYYLHNLYNAFENIFQRVAEAFENDISDKAQWHAQLLRRMTLDIEGVRPRLLSDEAYQCLDELRRFRHLFRNMYTADLDSERLRLVWNEARRLQSLYRVDIERFLIYLDRLE
jgi:HepT-like protein